MSNTSRSQPENVILKCYNFKEKTFFEILLCFVFTVSVSLYTFNLFPFFFCYADLNPIPRLLLANVNNILVMDVDSTHNVHNVVTGTSPLAVTFLQVAQDERVFWVDYNSQLWENSNNGRKKVCNTGGTCSSNSSYLTGYVYGPN